MVPGPGPGPVMANNQNPDPLKAAVYRFIGALVALCLCLGVFIFVKDIPSVVELALAGLLGAAVLSIEEYLKSHQGL